MGGTGRQAAESRQRLTERSRRLEACKQTQAGRSKRAVAGRRRGRHGRYAGVEPCKSRLAEKKAGMHAGKKSKDTEPGRQTERQEQTRKGI
jgi:hypothetical protein